MRLAVPSAGEQLLSMMVGIVDTFLVGHLGSSALTAVGLSFQWVMFAMVLFGAIGTGATALVARMVGAKDWQGANRVLRQALFVAFVMGVIAVIALQLFVEPALRLMGATDDALIQGIAYLRLAGSVFMFSAPMFVGNACLRGAGDTRTPMKVMLVVNALNIVVAWTFVNGELGMPRMGVAGSAMGALVGRTVGGLLVLALLLRGQSGLKLRIKGWRIDWPIIRRILNVGLPTGAEQLAMRLGMMSFARAVSALGTVAYAAHQVALNAESLSYMPGFGFAMAATTLVGQGLGAKDKRRAEGDGYLAFYIGMVLMLVMGIAFILFARPLVSFFTDEPEVIEMAVTPLRLIGIVQPFLAAAMIFAGALRGAGETRAPMLVNGINVWVVRVPLTLLFTQVFTWGLTGAWIAMSIDLVIRGSLLFARFRSGKWKTVEV